LAPSATDRFRAPPCMTHLADIGRVIDCDTTGGRVWLRANATAPESVIFRTE
jgi:hypothetical protein